VESQLIIVICAIIAVIYIVACALCGWSVAIEKNRNEWEGFSYGAFFGPLGILIIACLPTRAKTKGVP
jgi:hypothetical protein